ncbi:hypothetical protein ACFSCX_13955 [Bacillus salitolerans]|uniref:Uncharacterized protein n=1 Tax=Bacillus salitolerans TaxID=1437434 RepID=A0ABW4LRD8_9BACI
MEIVIYFTLAWLVCMTIFLLPKPLSPIENVFLFFIISLAIKNSFSIVGVNLKLIEPSTKHVLFIAYILYRTIIYPGTLLIVTNILFSHLPAKTKGLLLGLGILFIFSVENLGEYLHLYKYVKWNNWYNTLEIFILFMICIVTSRIIMKVHRKEKAIESL